jgi:hypothetical protein
MGIPVDDPNGDVMFPRFGGSTAYGFQEEQQVTTYTENERDYWLCNGSD